jgi:hypothetical protein
MGNEPPALRTARISHNLPQQAPACSPAPRPSRRGAGRADPAQPVRRHRGAPSMRGGDSPQGFPLEASEAPQAPQARRREGLKPNGRDGKDGTGRSPKARRRSSRRHAHWPSCGPCTRRAACCWEIPRTTRVLAFRPIRAQLPGVPPGYFMALAFDGPVPEGIAYSAMPSTPPPEPVRRRRRSDSAVGLEHRARPLPRPDFAFHRAQDGTAWARC